MNVSNCGLHEPAICTDAHQNAHQRCAFRLLLRYGHATATIISLYFTLINRLFTSTYKPQIRTVDPMLNPQDRLSASNASLFIRGIADLSGLR